MTDNFKALIVTEIFWNYDSWHLEEDYTFLNPEHIMFIRSRNKRVLMDVEDGPVRMWSYEVYLTRKTDPIYCIADDRDAFMKSIT